MVAEEFRGRLLQMQEQQVQAGQRAFLPLDELRNILDRRTRSLQYLVQEKIKYERYDYDEYC